MTTEHEKYHCDTFEHVGIIWGAKIDASNDREPLPWLKDNEYVYCHWNEATSNGPYPVHCVCGWDKGFQIRLPADHQYYHAFNPAPAPESTPTEDIVRILRVIEYVGPRSAIENQVMGSIHGERTFGVVTIKAATVGTFPEILKGSN